MARDRQSDGKLRGKRIASWSLIAGAGLLVSACVLFGIAYWFSPPQVVVFDGLAACGGMTQLRAKLERRGWLGFGQDLAGEPLRFAIEEAGAHQIEKTGPEGVARWTLSTAGLREGNYVVHAQHLESGAQDRATLFVRSPTTPLLIVDIDGTICAGSPWQVLFLPPHRIPPLPSAVEALRSLDEYFVVYLTAREDNLYSLTERWLQTWGFPQGPLLCRPDYVRSPFQFKLGVLDQLAQQFARIVAGVGDRPHDAEAYLACGIPAIVIGPRQPAFPPEAHFVKSWREIPPLLRSLQRGSPARDPGASP